MHTAGHGAEVGPIAGEQHSNETGHAQRHRQPQARTQICNHERRDDQRNDGRGEPGRLQPQDHPNHGQRIDHPGPRRRPANTVRSGRLHGHRSGGESGGHDRQVPKRRELGDVGVVLQHQDLPGTDHTGTRCAQHECSASADLGCGGDQRHCGAERDGSRHGREVGRTPQHRVAPEGLVPPLVDRGGRQREHRAHHGQPDRSRHGRPAACALAGPPDDDPGDQGYADIEAEVGRTEEIIAAAVGVPRVVPVDTEQRQPKARERPGEAQSEPGLSCLGSHEDTVRVPVGWKVKPPRLGMQ